MSVDIEALRRVHAATTEGEWTSSSSFEDDVFYIFGGGKYTSQIGALQRWGSSAPGPDGETEGEANAEFIVLAHNQMPALLDELEELRAYKHRGQGFYQSVTETDNENTQYYFLVLLQDRNSQEYYEFNCWAEDADHAREQAENAYPGDQVLIVERTIEPLHNFVVTLQDASYQEHYFTCQAASHDEASDMSQEEYYGYTVKIVAKLPD